MFFRIFILAATLFVSACSNMYSVEALAKKGEWYQIGYRDGARGLASRPASELKQLAKGAIADFSAYDKGYKQGIDEYCIVGNAYSIGLAGMPYHGVCSFSPDGLRFNLEWQRGYQAYQNSL